MEPLINVDPTEITIAAGTGADTAAVTVTAREVVIVHPASGARYALAIPAGIVRPAPTARPGRRVRVRPDR